MTTEHADLVRRLESFKDSKHTPGQWQIRYAGRVPGVVCGGVMREYVNGSGQDQLFMVCGVQDDNGGSDAQSANANLIAAAPQLLDDLRAAVNLIAQQAAELERLRAGEPVAWLLVGKRDGFVRGHMPAEPDSTRKMLAAADGCEWRAVAYTAPPLEAAPAVEARTNAARDVLAERKRQIEAEGWDAAHDDEHDSGEMASAASAYALAAADKLHPMSQGDGEFDKLPPAMWCWGHEWWKPAEPRRMLVKAGALILAEIERLDRAAIAATKEKPL